MNASVRPVVRIENLSKQYRIGVRRQGHRPYKTLRETIVEVCGGAWHRLRANGRGPTGNEASDNNSFWALRNVSFDVSRGEVIGIVGSNGAGKSTLLKILSRIVEPTTGRATVRGRIGSLLEVGTGFHPELTGRENVYLNGAILGMNRVEIDRKFDEIVAFSELEKFLDTPVKRYSSGMHVRLAFAVAAHLEPEIMIVDEVLAVGDAQFQEKCMGTMQRRASSGRTILFVSHNMASIQQLCTRAILLKRGGVVADGTPREIVQAYLSDLRAPAEGSVENWPDRDGSGHARILKFEVTEGTGNVDGSVPVGGDVRFHIVADFFEPVMDPALGLVIQRVDGDRLVELQSFHDGLRLGRVHGKVAVSVRVRSLGLYPGDYLVSPWIADASGNDIFDWPKQCVTLRVFPAPGPFGDLRLNPKWGKYWVQSEWRQVDHS